MESKKNFSVDYLNIGVLLDPFSDFSGAFLDYGKKIWISRVIFSQPRTIVIWNDGSKTMSKCSDIDSFSKETGLLICVYKKLFGSEAARNLIATWAPEDLDIIDLKTVRKRERK